MYRVDRMIYKKPKRFNWFYKKLGYVRPGSIEIPGCFWLKNQNRTVRSSMGDCHSFDPGSNPGPGAYLLYLHYLTIFKSSASILYMSSSITVINDIVLFTPNSDSNSKPLSEYILPPASFTIRYAAA